MKIVHPLTKFIGPGPLTIHTERVEVREEWWMGNLISETQEIIHETHQVTAPCPGMDGPEDDDNSWPLRGQFTFLDHTWTVVRDDDPTFWGFRNGVSRTKAEMLEDMEGQHRAALFWGAVMGMWDLSEDGSLPLRPAQRFSIQAMAGENKTLMAHLMVELGIFTSVGQAKKNGWDVPLQLGRHQLGPRKKRVVVEITP